jgi:hypothetical protein
MNVKSANNTSKWQMGSNSAFKGLSNCFLSGSLLNHFHYIQKKIKKNYDSNNGFKNLYYIVILNVYKLLLYGLSATDKYFCAQ